MADSGEPNAADVLLVEDDPGDVRLIRAVFEQSRTPVRLHVVSDGEQALRFLRRIGHFGGVPRPRLILLDLDLPLRNGLEVLAELKTDRDLLTIPVVVVTSSRAEKDIQRSYALHANAYITKPSDFDGLSDVIQRIAGCFLDLIELPNWQWARR